MYILTDLDKELIKANLTDIQDYYTCTSAPNAKILITKRKSNIGYGVYPVLIGVKEIIPGGFYEDHIRLPSGYRGMNILDQSKLKQFQRTIEPLVGDLFPLMMGTINKIGIRKYKELQGIDLGHIHASI